MDPLTLAASVIAVVQLSQTVLEICRRYIGAVKDCPRDLFLISIEVSTLSGMLVPIQRLVETSTAFPGSESLMGPIEECREALAELQELLSQVKGADSTHPPPDETGRAKRGLSGLFTSRLKILSTQKKKKTSSKNSLKALAWPVKQKKAMDLLSVVKMHKDTINLILTTDATSTVRVVEKKVDAVTRSMDKAERDRILDWLEKFDPSSLHRQALRLHESHTSSWLLSCPEWTSWMSSSPGTDISRLFWIHGIPGAGKTILASFIIEHLQSLGKSESSDKGDSLPVGVGYYYCWHERKDNNEAIAFLSGALAQLYRQVDDHELDDEIITFYGRNHIALGFGMLGEALAQVSKRFGRVFLVIDALDESCDRSGFLAATRILVSELRITNLFLLVTSRFETDIRIAMEALSPPSIHLSMTNEYVDRDIRQFVHTELHSDKKFTRWPTDLLQIMEEKLSDGAKGMFRWASCQLQILRRLHTKGAILEAIESLPETLDETYERILTSIPPQSQKVAQRALELLCSDDRTGLITAENLLEATFWGFEDNTRYPDDRLCDIESLQEICVCLVTVAVKPAPHRWIGASSSPEFVGRDIKLAHYTVKEFLYSPRILKGPAKCFGTSPVQARVATATVKVRSLMRASDDADAPVSSDWFDFCWHSLVTDNHGPCWGTEDELLEDEEIAAPLCRLIIEFVDPTNGYLSRGARGQLALIHQHDNAYAMVAGLVAPISQWGTPEDEGPAALIAHLLILGLPRLAKRCLDSLSEHALESVLETPISFDIFRGCTLLDVATARGYLPSLELLVSLGAKPRPGNKLGFYLKTWWQTPKFTAFVLGLEGVDLNDIEVPVNPLQAAVCWGRWDDALRLLKAGADPNLVGDPSLPESAWVFTKGLPRHMSAAKMLKTWHGGQGVYNIKQGPSLHHLLSLLRARGDLSETDVERTWARFEGYRQILEKNGIND